MPPFTIGTTTCPVLGQGERQRPPGEAGDPDGAECLPSEPARERSAALPRGARGTGEAERSEGWAGGGLGAERERQRAGPRQINSSHSALTTSSRVSRPSET